jgi:hypothetical protein
MMTAALGGFHAIPLAPVGMADENKLEAYRHDEFMWYEAGNKTIIAY